MANWVVLKFGGTSVSSVANWQNIARIVQARRADGLRPVIVHSALSGITDRLETLLIAAMTGEQAPVLAEIEQRHRDLAAQLGVRTGADLERHFTDLRQIASGIALVGEVSDRVRARLLAMCSHSSHWPAAGRSAARRPRYLRYGSRQNFRQACLHRQEI